MAGQVGAAVRQSIRAAHFGFVPDFSTLKEPINIPGSPLCLPLLSVPITHQPAPFWPLPRFGGGVAGEAWERLG